MAVITNSAEGGTNGIVPTTGNTGGASGDASSFIFVGSDNAFTFSNAHPAHGTLGYRLSFGTTSNGNIRWDIAESGRLVHSFYIYLTVLPTATEYIAAIRSSSTNMCIAVIGSDGKFIMQNAVGSGISASRAPNTFPLNQQVRVEIAVTKGTTTSNGIIEYAYYLGDANTAVYSWSSATVNTGTNDVAQVTIGRNTIGAEARTMWFDTIRAESRASGWIGPSVSVTSLINTAEGGTNGAVPTTANTGGASGDAMSVVNIGSGNTIIFSDFNPAHGTMGYEMNYGTTAGGNLRWDFVESGRLVHSFYIELSSLPTATEYIAGIRHASGYMCIATIGPDGKLIMQNAASVGVSASRAASTFPVEQKVRVEIAVTKGTTTSDGTIEYAYYLGESTSPLASWSSNTQNTGTADIAQVIIGRNTAAGEPRTIWYDTIRVQNLPSGWIGPYSPQNTIPIARLASPPVSIEPYTTQILEGSTSSDSAGGTIVQYDFRQISGTPVSLQGSGSTRTYKAPGTLGGTSLVFGLTVTDDQDGVSSEDTATHTILGVNERAVIGGVQVPIEVRSASGAKAWYPFAPVLRSQGRSDRDLNGNSIDSPPDDGRNSLVYGMYKPSAATTGVIPGTVLTDYNSSTVNSFSITVDDTVIEGKRIYGDIKINAANVIIRNCELVGGNHTPTGASGVVDCNGDNVYNALIQDCDIVPRKISLNRDGIVGHEYTALRCHVRNTIDGFGVFNNPGGSTVANVTLKGNYVHHLAYFFPDYKNGVSGATWHTDGTHNDGIQVQGGSDIYIQGNYLEATAIPGPGTGANPDKPLLIGTGNANGSAMLIQKQPSLGALVNVVAEQNWFSNGLALTSLQAGSYTVQNNKYARATAQYPGWSGYWIRVYNRASTTVTGLLTNRWEDNNQLMTEPRTSGIHYNS